MSTFADRPNSALLVIDVQHDVVADAHTTEDLSVVDAADVAFA